MTTQQSLFYHNLTLKYIGAITALVVSLIIYIYISDKSATSKHLNKIEQTLKDLECRYTRQEIRLAIIIEQIQHVTNEDIWEKISRAESTSTLLKNNKHIDTK